MAELREVFIFCALYSGVVMYALWQTVSQRKMARMYKHKSS